MNINIDEYDLINPDSVDVIDCDSELFYDIEVECDNSFHIVNDNDDMMLVHNCDGYHIKGLLMNLFNYFWPELLKINFLYEFVTPILSVKQGKNRDFFYNKADYETHILKNETKNSVIKYYKGLGTLESDVTKMLFKNIDKHLIKFHYEHPEVTDDLIDMVFRQKRAEERKNWLLNYKYDNFVDKFGEKTTFESFIDNELIEFSMADNIRSIPSVVDGLKPSQRKILYTMFKIGGKGEINVGELFGFVKAHAAYHHGPQSLDAGIINMAQDYVNSNNISLLLPLGGFGTRLSGGADASASRYLNTTLRDITEDMFLTVDNNIIEYKIEDGKTVEPYYYTPIIPIILLNGTEGIGTGWSSSVPKYKIEDIIQYIENKLSNKRKNIELTPFYEKFKGAITKEDEMRYVTYGIIKRLNTTTVNITELPIGVWNDNYYQHLDKLVDDKVIKSYTKDCTDTDVDIKIKMTRESLEIMSDDDLIKMFKLTSRLSLNNMHLFDSTHKIKKYDTPYDIIDDFYITRMDFYQKRKKYMLDSLISKKERNRNLIEFMKLILSKKITINNNSYESIILLLEKFKISKIDNSYDYIMKMPLYRMTKDELDKVNAEYEQYLKEIELIENTTIESMWVSDLNDLKKSLKKFRK